jgi:hypothetical protein
MRVAPYVVADAEVAEAPACEAGIRWVRVPPATPPPLDVSVARAIFLELA